MSGVSNSGNNSIQGFFETSDMGYECLDGSADGVGINEPWFQKGRNENRDWVMHLAPQLRELEAEAKSQIAKLDEKIAACEDPAEKVQLRQLRDDIADALFNIKSTPPGLHRAPEEFRALFDERKLHLQNAILGASAERFERLTLPTERLDRFVVERYPLAHQIRGAKASDGAGDDDKKYDPSSWPSYNEYSKMLTSNPEAARELLAGMGTDERSMFMQQITQEMQQINQMFTMMSNIAKSMHDTAKAAISNMRV